MSFLPRKCRQKAQRKILKLAKEQRVGGTAARKIVAEVRAEAEPPSGEPEAAEGSPALGLVMAVETLLRCDPEAENLEGLSAPALVRAAEILTALARRLRGDDFFEASSRSRGSPLGDGGHKDGVHRPVC